MSNTKMEMPLITHRLTGDLVPVTVTGPTNEPLELIRQTPIPDFNKIIPLWDFDGETNFKVPFKTIMKTCALEYKEWVKATYSVKDVLSDSEFCRLNHLPSELLSKFSV